MAGRGSLYVGQLKKWRLRASYRPPKHPLLSGVCLISGLYEDTVRYTYITFTESMVTDLARIMPFGLRPDMQAYLSLIQHTDESWGVYCIYVQKPHIRRLIFSTPKMPSWVKWSKEVTHGEDEKAARSRPGQKAQTADDSEPGRGRRRRSGGH